MPLFGKFRIQRAQAGPASCVSSGAIRTSGPLVTISYDSLPLMALSARPPDPSAGAGGHVARQERRVLLTVPFTGKLRIYGLEAVALIYSSS